MFNMSRNFVLQQMHSAVLSMTYNKRLMITYSREASKNDLQCFHMLQLLKRNWKATISIKNRPREFQDQKSSIKI